MSVRKRKALIGAASKKIGVSVRFLAKKHGISNSFMHTIMKEEDFKYIKRQKAPQVPADQENDKRSASMRLHVDRGAQTAM